jgi:hypothetical protein
VSVRRTSVNHRDVARRLHSVVRARTCFHRTQSRARDALAWSQTCPRGSPGEGSAPRGRLYPPRSRDAATPHAIGHAATDSRTRRRQGDEPRAGRAGGTSVTSNSDAPGQSLYENDVGSWSTERRLSIAVRAVGGRAPVLAAVGSASGRIRLTWVPAPSLSSQIRPPWASMMEREIARPRPAPGVLRDLSEPAR